MYRIRKGRVVRGVADRRASAVLAATVAGNWIPGSPLEGVLLADQGPDHPRPDAPTASSPRCCRSGCCCARATTCPASSRSAPSPCSSSACSWPTRRCPVRRSTTTFQNGGPTFQGDLFPFVFICIMCGAISGFHALVSSGTTPKMIDKESAHPAHRLRGDADGGAGRHRRPDRGRVAADPKLYYDINVDLAEVAEIPGASCDELYTAAGQRPDTTHLPVNVDTRSTCRSTWRASSTWSAASRCAAGPAAP